MIDRIKKDREEAKKYTQEEWDKLIDEEDEEEDEDDEDAEYIAVRPGEEEYIDGYDPDDDDDDRVCF